jgi:peptide deformylase
MAILPIYLFGTDILKKTARPVETHDDSSVKLIYDMFETMREANGLGLAATQVGDLRRVITIDIADVDESNAEGESENTVRPTDPALPRTLALINPEILSSEGSWTTREGCLSIPDIHSDVERPEVVRVRFRDADFKEQELLANGLLARVIQHELDHLNGILFIDRINKAKRSLLLPRLRAIRKGEIEPDYPVVTAAGE